MPSHTKHLTQCSNIKLPMDVKVTHVRLNGATIKWKQTETRLLFKTPATGELIVTYDRLHPISVASYYPLKATILR